MSTKTKPRAVAKPRREGSTQASRSNQKTRFEASRSADATRDRRLVILISVALAIVTLATYSAVGSHPFVNYDDQNYVAKNPHVISGLTWDTVKWAMTSTDASNWHPATWLSHALDCDLFGLNPAGHHWMNVLFHALNAVLLFLLLWRVTGAAGRSLLVAALFALHPLNVESVAWIAERKNVLSTFFFLLTLGAYGYYARGPNIKRYLVVAVLFVLGLAAKPMVITLPFVLLLVDYWPLGRIEVWTKPAAAFPVRQLRFTALLLEKLPLLALSAGSAVMTMVAQTDAEVSGLALPLGVRLETTLYAYGMYLWKAIWPLHLALIYPHPGRTLPLWQPMLGAAINAIALAIGWKQRFERPYWLMGWLWFLGTAVPIIGIVQVGVQVVADRYAYLTLIGVFVAVVWMLSSLADDAHINVAARWAAASIILLAFTFLTWRQVSYWKSTQELWSHALQVTQGNTMAESFLATELLTQGRYQEGMEHLRNYTRVEPLDPGAHARVGFDYDDHGQTADAIREYEAAIRAANLLERYGSSDFPPQIRAVTYANLAINYAQQGNQTKAQEDANNALQADSAAVSKMISDLAQLLQQHPAAKGYVRLGLLLREFGHAKEAEQAFAKAQELDPRIQLPEVAVAN